MSRVPHTCTEACASSPPAGGLNRLPPCKTLRSTQVQDCQASAPRVRQASRLQGLPVPLCGLVLANTFHSCAVPRPAHNSREDASCTVPSSCIDGSTVQRPGCSWPQRAHCMALGAMFKGTALHPVRAWQLLSLPFR